MKYPTKLILTAVVLTGLFFAFPAFGQDAAPVAGAGPDRPMYEKFGMTPTQLFALMASFTALLVLFVMILAGSVSNIIQFRKDKLKGLKTVLLLIALSAGQGAFSASPEITPGPEYLVSFPDSAFWSFLVFDLILVFIIIYFIRLMRTEISDYSLPRKFNLFARWNKKLTDAVPVEEESSILLDHDYDGIRELDNNLPPWWKYGFYVTIAWSVAYLVYYHVMGAGPLQEAEYIAEMEEGDRLEAEYKAAHPELITAENVTLLTDASSISQGRSVYTTYCQTCHMEGGKGGIGPNLTDKNWIYDGDIKGVFSTITNGAQNGMVAWKELLPANEIQAVASYILQLEYVAPPVGKAPQGDHIVE